MTTHYLYEENSVVRSCSVPNLINSIQGCIYSGIESYGIVRTIKIIVYSAGNSYYRNAVFIIEKIGSCKCTVATYGCYSFNSVLLIPWGRVEDEAIDRNCKAIK